MRQTATRCWRCAVPSIMARSTKYLCVIDSDYEKRQNDRMQGSGSRLVEVSPAGQTSAPGTSVPQKIVGTLPCPIVMITDFGLPEGSIPLVAHDRGVAN